MDEDSFSMVLFVIMVLFLCLVLPCMQVPTSQIQHQAVVLGSDKVHGFMSDSYYLILEENNTTYLCEVSHEDFLLSAYTPTYSYNYTIISGPVHFNLSMLGKWSSI